MDPYTVSLATKLLASDANNNKIIEYSESLSTIVTDLKENSEVAAMIRNGCSLDKNGVGLDLVWGPKIRDAASIVEQTGILEVQLPSGRDICKAMKDKGRTI